MGENSASIEYVRVALALGVILSMMIYERRRWTGSAALVAGYMGLFVNRPLYVVTVLALAFATHFIANRLVTHRMLLDSRRRLVATVLVGMTLHFMIGLVAYHMSPEAPWLGALGGIGFVLPGLIAQDIGRHGIRLKVLTVLGNSLLTISITSGPTGNQGARADQSEAHGRRGTKRDGFIQLSTASPDRDVKRH